MLRQIRLIFVSSKLFNNELYCSSRVRNQLVYFSTKKAKFTKKINETLISEVVDIEPYKNELNLVIENIKKKFDSHITINYSAGMLHDIQIEKSPKNYVKLSDVAQISMKGANIFILNMSYNPELIPKVEKGLMLSGMNLGIQKQSNHIYVSIPKITHELKEKLVKSAKISVQKGKEYIRQLQNNQLKEIILKEEDYSKDVIHNSKTAIQDITKEYLKQLDGMFDQKEKELLIEL